LCGNFRGLKIPIPCFILQPDDFPEARASASILHSQIIYDADKNKERFNHFPAQMSGGEQQRVAIARAIAKRPEVLLCDEPTGALDYQTGKIVLEVIECVNRELGTTTAVITHNASIAQMADRVIRIGSGEITSIERNASKARPSDLIW
jgi:putative ABC transport system ATP-binding protein